MGVDFISWAVFLAWDFLFSVWNAYAAGYNLRLAAFQEAKQSEFLNIAAYSALVIGFVGATNSTISILGILISYYSNRFVPILVWLYDLSFIVTGAVTLALGVMILVHSITIRTLAKGEYPSITVYDILTSIWDSALYVKGTPVRKQLEKEELTFSENLRSESVYGPFMIMIFFALVFPVINTYEAYIAGVNEAEAFQEQAKDKARNVA